MEHPVVARIRTSKSAIDAYPFSGCPEHGSNSMCRAGVDPYESDESDDTAGNRATTRDALFRVFEECGYSAPVKLTNNKYAVDMGPANLSYFILGGQVAFHTGNQCKTWFPVRKTLGRNRHLISLLARTEELENVAGIMALAQSYGVRATPNGTSSVQVSINFNIRSTDDLRAIMNLIAEVPSDMRG